MKIEQIISRRFSENQINTFSIIYEWEDVLSEGLKSQITGTNYISYRLAHHFPFIKRFLLPYRNSLVFYTNANGQDKIYNKRNIVPFIIDFFLHKDELNLFYNNHSENKIIFVSSPFDYDFLIKNNFPKPIGLIAYSLPDKYAITEKPFKKKYDIILTGRQDPLLYSFFKEYVIKHPTVTYVKRGQSLDNDESKTEPYYMNGETLIGSIHSREEYMSLLSQAKISLYGIQGFDKDTKDYYHVTPRFLELIASGCHVIAHYKEGADSEFYELNKFSPSIESYEDFEKSMDNALINDVDMTFYASYLKKHYTSSRIKEIKELLKNI